MYVGESLEIYEYEHGVHVSDEYLARRSKLFKVLGDPNRLKLLYLLLDGEKCVSELLPFFDILQPTVSIHLLQLHDMGILNARRDGRKRYYSLVDETILALIDCFCEKIMSKEIE